jgi:hypothetical protein
VSAGARLTEAMAAVRPEVPLRERVEEVLSRANSAVHMVEDRLVEMLAGEPLLGLNVVVPGTNFRAAVVHGDDRYGIDTWIRVGCREPVLVVGKSGELLLVRATHESGVVSWKHQGKFRPADLWPVVRAVTEVCRRHARVVAEKGAADRRALDLVDRLEGALRK